MRKLLTLLFYIGLVLSFAPHVYADVAPLPDSFEPCRRLEREVRCSTYEHCTELMTSTEFRATKMEYSEFASFFTGSFGRYCYQPYYGRLTMAIIISFFLELGIYKLFIPLTRARVFAILGATSISLPSMYFIYHALPSLYKFNITGLLTRIASLEIMVIVFEFLFLRFFMRNISIKRLLLVCALANIVSALLGVIIYSFFYANTP